MGQTASSTQHSATSSSPASCPVDHSAFEKRTQGSSPSPSPSAAASSSCPVDHATLANRAQSPSRSAASCPVDHASSSSRSSSTAATAPAQCPVPHSSDEALDPRTHLPVLTQERAPLQTTDLPTERTESSIPRDAAGNWDYPSPQQFYNALVRKGFPTPENEVETMVQIHNFLNEAAWDEVQKWEAQENKLRLSSLRLRWSLRLTNVCSGLAGTRGYNSYASKGVRVSSRQKRGFSYSRAGSYQADSSMCFFFGMHRTLSYCGY